MEQVFDWDRLGANDLVGKFEIRPETMARLMRAELGWEGEGTYFLLSDETNEVVVGHDKENTVLTIQAKVVRVGDFTRRGSADSIARRPSSVGSKASQTRRGRKVSLMSWLSSSDEKELVGVCTITLQPEILSKDLAGIVACFGFFFE